MFQSIQTGDSLSYIQSASKTKKVLFATFSGDGHFNPLTSLAVSLQKIGYDVRWYTSNAYAPKLKKLNIHHYPFAKAMDVNSDTLETLFPERTKIKGQVKKLRFDIINTFVLRAPEMYADIMELHKEFEFDLLVADNCFTAVPFVKYLMVKPVLVIGVIPLTETSKDLPPAMMGLTPSYSFFGKIKQAALRFASSNIIFREPNVVFTTLLKKYNIPVISKNLFDYNVRCADFFLQSGTPGFEYKRSDMSKHVHFIGALLPYTTANRNMPWFDERMNKYDKVVLITQGTVEKDINKLMIPALEAFRNSDTLVVATTGGSGTGYLRSQFPMDNYIIEDYIPFAEIMPYADLYISNGGYGGVLLSIQNGVPMIVAGIHEGKIEINARVGYFELGINLKTEMPASMQIQNAANQIFHHDIYKQKTEALKAEFATYNTTAIFKKFVEQIMQITSQKPAAMHSN